MPGCTGSIVGDGAPEDEPIGPGELDDEDEEPAGTCEADPCDLHSQCGCEAGEACDLDPAALASGGTECRPATAGAQSQAGCDTGADCAAGYGCFGDPGQCRKYCDGDSDCGFGHCLITVTYSDGGTSTPVPGAEVCSKACKPESPTGSGCPSGLGCFFYYRDPNGSSGSGDEFWYTDCRAAATSGGLHDADCEANGDADCAPGYNCLSISYSDGTTAARCRQTCVWEVAGEPGERRCDGGRTCGELNDIIIGDTEYGSCR